VLGNRRPDPGRNPRPAAQTQATPRDQRAWARGPLPVYSPRPEPCRASTKWQSVEEGRTAPLRRPA